MSAGSGPGRRLGEAEEDRAVELYKADASTRTVARELEISRSSAQALRVRLLEAGRLTAEETTVTENDDQADNAKPETGAPDQPDAPVTREPETLKELEARSEKLGAQLILLNDQAAKVAGQVEDLDKARIEALAGGGDSARFARERTALETEHARLTQDASVVGGWLAEVDGEIARRETAIEATRNLATARELLDGRTAGRQGVYGRSGARQQAAITAVHDAAVDYAQVPADEAEADRLVAEAHAQVAALCEQLGEPVPPPPAPPELTHLRMPPGVDGGAPLALRQAAFAARRGDVKTVAVKLAEADGYTPPAPPTPGEIAAWQAREAEAAKHRGRLQSRPVASPVLRPGDEASVGVDEHGNPVRRPLPPHPRDSYTAPMLTGYGALR